jgi:hypothetical protein
VAVVARAAVAVMTAAADTIRATTVTS